MKKRILSFILVLAVMLGCFTGFAFADTVKVIDWLNITDLATPCPGEKADYTYMFYCGHDNAINYSDQNPTTWKNGISWKDLTENRFLVPDVDTFIEGHEYMVIVETMAADGFEFYVADGNNNGNNVDLYLNSKFVPNRSTNQYGGKKYAIFTYEYGACKKKATELSLNYERPVYNGKLSDVNMTFSSNLKVLDSSWTEDGAAVNDTARFKAGKVYRYSVDLIAADGYAFPHVYNYFSVIDRDLITFKKGDYAIGWSQNYDHTDQLVIHVEYVFQNIVDTNVTHIALPDIDTPVTGERPDFFFEEPYGTSVDGVWWECENIMLASTDKFEAGKKYTVNIALVAAEGFNMNLTHATVSGKSATVTWYEHIGAYVVTYTFDACAGAVNNVTLTLDTPQVGKAPSYNVPGVSGNGYEVNTHSFNPSYEKNGVRWFDVVNNKHMQIGVTSSVCTAGGVYRVMVTLAPLDGFSFTSDVTATVNGKDAFVEKLDNELINIYYYFEPLTVPNPCKNGHSFTNYVYNGDATVEKDGTKTAKCDRCAATDTVTAEGTKLPAPPPEKKPVEIVDTTKIFTDVKAGKWYTNAINYAYSHGFIAGVSATEFGRDVPVTRGMFITILARIAGVDTSKEANKVETKFTDVKTGKYYTAAIKWASENGVVSGLSDTEFGPEVAIERQQLCTMIVNFAKFIKVELTASQAEIAFADSGSIRKYAKDAVKVCQKAGIIKGYTADGVTTFKPTNTATRAEAAQILYVFHKDFVAK